MPVKNCAYRVNADIPESKQPENKGRLKGQPRIRNASKTCWVSQISANWLRGKKLCNLIKKSAAVGVFCT